MVQGGRDAGEEGAKEAATGLEIRSYLGGLRGKRCRGRRGKRGSNRGGDWELSRWFRGGEMQGKRDQKRQEQGWRLGAI